jgi:hypothetical protein
LPGAQHLAYEAAGDGESDQRHRGDHHHNGEMGTAERYRCAFVSG